MPDTGLFKLQARVLREVRASCGCALVLVHEKVIDGREGQFVAQPSLVVVPCERGEGHVIQMRETVRDAQAGDDLEEIIKQFEEAMT